MRLHSILFVITIAALLTGSGCYKGSSPGKAFHMGERVQVGPLVYNVLEANWHTDLSTAEGPKLPKNKFLLLRISITNGGAADATVPLLALLNDRGAEFLEESEVAGVENWLGLFRRFSPAATEQGIIVFDVPSGTYSLRVTDGAPPGEERISLIEIPLQFTPQGVPAESLAPKPEAKQ